MNIPLDDSRVTAYALGELDDSDRAEFESWLNEHAEAREEVEAIRAAATQIEAEYGREPEVRLTPVQRDSILGASERKLEQRSATRWWKPLLAAAGICAVVGVVGLMMTTPKLGLSRLASKGVISPFVYSLDGDAPPARPPAPKSSKAAPAPPPPACPAPPNMLGSKREDLQLRQKQVDELRNLGYSHSSFPSAKTADRLATRLSVRADFTDDVKAAIEIDNRAGNTPDRIPQTPVPGTESYPVIVENEFKFVKDEPLSTFSIDVDTASYANVRRFLNDGTFPPKEVVRIEELINYFKYDYPQPEAGEPFSINVEVAQCPWNEEHSLARIGLKGKIPPMDDRPPCSLVFLCDTSGSMDDPDKLPLLKKSMKMLAEELRGDDRIGIVTYSSSAQVALESTPCDRKERILQALDQMVSGGSTNGGEGIREAYDMATRNFVKGGINRVILSTDGDFNTGLTQTGEFVDLIQRAAKTGVFLTVLGFGKGNLKDTNLEALADKGNGHYAYIDSFNEARKVLLDEAGSTIITIAKDVKIQVEFNPGKVGAYRLIGYEDRALAAKDFNDDRKDAGEIGAGHTVTAFYEIVPPGKAVTPPGVDPLKYQANPSPPPEPPASVSNDLMTVKLRYKQPDSDTSAKIEVPVPAQTVSEASVDFKFGAAVAEFGLLLRDSESKGTATFAQDLELAQQGKGPDPEGYRAEFINLVKTAQALAR